MSKLKLFSAPHTCALVPTIALEEINEPFTTHLVRLARNQQNDPEYLSINPKGKVPTLLIDDMPMTETPAILSWLHSTFPYAQLMPAPNGPFEAAQNLSDLLFFASTVHPAVARMAMPFRFFPDKTAALEKARPMAIEALAAIYQKIDARLSEGPWWYGQSWSVVDAYLLWTWRRVAMIGFPEDPFPNIIRHFNLSVERPAVQRAIAREDAQIADLQSEGCYVRPA